MGPDQVPCVRKPPSSHRDILVLLPGLFSLFLSVHRPHIQQSGFAETPRAKQGLSTLHGVSTTNVSHASWGLTCHTAGPRLVSPVVHPVTPGLALVTAATTMTSQDTDYTHHDDITNH
jgi:hypothetical protein